MEKGGFRGFRKNEFPHSGKLVNTAKIDKVRSEKWPAVSLYLDELIED